VGRRVGASLTDIGGVSDVATGRTAWQALREELWSELDRIVDRIMSEGEPYWTLSDSSAEVAGPLREWGELRGKAQGIAYALAMMENPYLPNVDSIREKAMTRWEAGQE